MNAEQQRRNENTLLLRRLRDASNPFEIPNEMFRKLYRFPINLAQEFFLQLEPFLDDGRRITKIPKVVRYIVALHFYAHGSYQKSVGTDKLCSMSQSAVSNCITNVTNVIVYNFSGRFIKFPSTVQEIVQVKNDFFEKFHFPGIIGVIDGTHISIVPPVFGRIPPRAVFLNRKNYYSINCQIICDSNLKILSICPRYPGSVHDAAIWIMSNIYNDLKNRYRNGERSSWLIGDSGYPLQPFLQTPILNAVEGTPEGRFNRSLCSARNCIERCIGILKGLFRCLLRDRALHYKPNVAAKITIACSTLYNILKTANADIDNYYCNEDRDDVHGNNEDVNEQEFLQIGTNIRNNIIGNNFQ